MIEIFPFRTAAAGNVSINFERILVVLGSLNADEWIDGRVTFDGFITGALQEQAGTAALRHDVRHSRSYDGVHERCLPGIYFQIFKNVIIKFKEKKLKNIQWVRFFKKNKIK